MAELTIPTQDEVVASLEAAGFEGDFEAAVNDVRDSFSRIDEDDPMVQVLGVEGYVELVEACAAHRLDPFEERARAVEELCEQAYERAFEAAVEGFENELDAASDEVGDQDDELTEFQSIGLLMSSPNGLVLIDWMWRWVRTTVTAHASFRSATARGRTSHKKWWRRKNRRLVGTASTLGSNVTKQIMWVPISSETRITTVVTAHHFRGPGWSVFPDRASFLRVGAYRNGQVVQKSASNKQTLIKVCSFTDSDPDLRELTWFARSSDAGIWLAVNGGV